MQKKPLSYENAFQYAASLCSRCEQCSFDIRKKLTARGISDADIRKIISRLEELRFIDDRRFAHAYAHDKLCFSSWGRRKIYQGLLLKAFPKIIIEETLESLDVQDYQDAAVRVVTNKARSYKEQPLSRENMIKLIKHAMTRGFEYALIAEIVRKLRQESKI